MAALIKEFNHLGGRTIQEHKKNFSLYKKHLKSLDDSERVNILHNLRAEYRQEEIFLTKLFLEFGLKDKIKHLMLQGDRILNKLVLNHKPFIFKDEIPDFFLHEMFPNVSYIVRNKCLINLAKTIDRDDIGEEFFKKILERYGIKTAMILLPVCEEVLIKDILTHYRVVLRERQLITLHQRFGPEFIKFYYAECCKYGLNSQFADQPLFAQYLSTKDITTFCQLLKYGKPKVGRTGFKNFIAVKKEDVLNEPDKYSSFIKRKMLHRLLTKEELQLYLTNKLPKKIADFMVYSISDDLKLFHIKERGSILAAAFKEKYGFDIHTKYSSKETGCDQINNLKNLLIAEDMLKFSLSEDDALEYLPFSTAFPLIKERINLTSDMNNRCELVLKLFKCAKNNGVETALVEALQYLNNRHKNEQSSIREDVFNYLNSNYKMEKLGADTWECLHEMCLTEQMLAEYSYTYRDMIEEELHYRFINGMDITEEFQRWGKNFGPHYYTLPSKNKELKKWMLLHLPETSKKIYISEDDQKTWPTSFFNLVASWNKENPKETISFYKYPEVLELVLKHYDGWMFHDVLANYVAIHPPQNAEEKKIQDDLLDKHLTKFADTVQIWRWLLKNRVEVIQKHIDVFFDKVYSIYHIKWFVYEMSKMHYTLLPGIARAKALDIIKETLESIERKDVKNSMSDSKQHLAIIVLSFEKDFLQMLNNDKFCPSGEAEVNVFDEFFKEILKLRQKFVGCLQNQTRSKEVMPVLMRFCFKDYFAYALPVLTVVMFNMPENDVTQPLRILRDRSVSVRKRALFFATTVGNAQTSYDALNYAGENEKNKSLQKFIVNRTFKNFRFVCNTASWELLMKHFKFVFEKDLETQCMIFQFNLIPRTYLAPYVEKVWQHIGKQWENQHTKVLMALNADTITFLSDALCDDIIQYSLLQSKEKMVSSDVDFIYSYLLAAGEQIDHRFQLVANNARIVADECSHLDFKEFNKKSGNICFLYKDLLRRLMTNEPSDETPTHRAEKKMLVNKLTDALPNLPLPYNHLDYQMQIEVCRCYLDDRSKIPELLMKLQKDVLERHGDMMLEYFNEFAGSQIKLIALEEEDKYRLNFVQKLLEKDNSTAVKLLAIHLMPGAYPASDAHALLFRNLIAKVETDSAPIVLLYLNRYLKNVCM